MPTRIKLNKEEIEEWLTSHPVTQQYFRKLKIEALARREAMAYGSLIQQTASETGEAYTRAAIQAEVYEACASPKLEDLLEEDTDEEG